MNIRLSLDGPIARTALIGALLGFCASLLVLVLCNFLVQALTDEGIQLTADAAPASFITAPFTEEKIGVHPDVLASVARYLPNSPRLHMRLAKFQRREARNDWSAAELHAITAIQLSPHDYRPRLLLASILESKEDFRGAEDSILDALDLAPSSREAHWQLANLNLYSGYRADSLDEFRLASSGSEAYFRAALEVVWNEFDGSADALRVIAPDDAKSQLKLALFLVERSRPLESAIIFRRIEPDALVRNSESSRYLNVLIASGEITLARELWRPLVERGNKPPRQGANVLWNAGLESDILRDFAQFDWSIGPSDYAQISIDSNTFHSGKRSLRIDFAGRETTRLEEEIKQLTLVRPGARYKLSYYVKTGGLVAPDGEGPRVVVTGPSSRERIALSDPAPKGSSDWRQATLEFVTTAEAVTVGIKQRPKFSFEDPTHGTVWFDDFELQEIRSH